MGRRVNSLLVNELAEGKTMSLNDKLSQSLTLTSSHTTRILENK